MTRDHKAAMLHATAHRLGLDGYARILASVRRLSGTTEQLAKRMKVDQNTMGKLLRWMRQMKLVHRKAYVRPAPHSRMVAVWAFGPEGDLPPPDRESEGKTPPSAMVIAFATIVQCLREEALTMRELAQELAMHEESGARYIRILRDHRMCFIESWDTPNIGTPVARYRFGIKQDAERPPRECARAAQSRHGKRYRSKLKHLELIAATTGTARPQADWSATFGQLAEGSIDRAAA